MPRKKKQAAEGPQATSATSQQPGPAPGPHVISPEAVYTLKGAQAALGLARGCLPREIRLGRLRVSKRAGKYLIPGAWLMDWVITGEVRRPQRQASLPEAPGIASAAG